MKLIFVTSIVFLTGAFASCTSSKVPNECKMFNCSLAEPSRVSCMSKCTYGNKEQICNVTSVNFKNCGKTTKIIPALVTNILSIPEFFLDAYSSVARPIAVDILTRIGVIKKNSVLDKILQSKKCYIAECVFSAACSTLMYSVEFFKLYLHARKDC